MTWHFRVRCLFLVLFSSLAFLIFSLANHGNVGAAPAAQPPPPDVARKIEPALLKTLLAGKDGLTPFIAHMSPGTLTVLPELPDHVAQRAALVRSLQTTAARTQAGVRTLLSARQQEGRA